MALKPKVLLLIPHLGGGGAEQVMETLARHLCADKYDLHLGLVTRSALPDLPLPSDVAVHWLQTRRVRAAAVPLLRLIRRIRPALIVSGMYHLNFLVLALRPLCPSETQILVRQNGALADGPRQLETQLLYRWLYPRADRVICQSAAMGDELRSKLGLRGNKLAILKNPVGLVPGEGDFERGAASGNREIRLLAAGRLAPEKGFDLLLEAFAQLKKRFPAADMVIAGEGSQREYLEAKARWLGILRDVQLAGHISRPMKQFSDATLFVLSSRRDAMPNALLEAAAVGLPIVTTPASAGLVELLHNQPGVWMAREASASALADALGAALEQVQHGVRFKHRWLEPFRLENAIGAYEDLFDEVLSRRSA